MQIRPNSKSNILIQSEWLSHQHRDSYASFIGHPTLLSYFAVAENVSSGRMKARLLEVNDHFNIFRNVFFLVEFQQNKESLQNLTFFARFSRSYRR